MVAGDGGEFLLHVEIRKDNDPRMAARLLRQVDEGTPSVRDYLLMLDTLAQNRGLNRLVQEIYEMLTVEVEKLAIYGMGKKAGVQEGREEGKAELLLYLLERKFGDLPVAVRTRVRTAHEPDLMRWTAAALGAGSLGDVFGFGDRSAV